MFVLLTRGSRGAQAGTQRAAAGHSWKDNCWWDTPSAAPVSLPTARPSANLCASGKRPELLCSQPSHYLHQRVHTHTHTTRRWLSVTGMCCISTERLQVIISVRNKRKYIKREISSGKRNIIIIYLRIYLFTCPYGAWGIHLFWGLNGSMRPEPSKVWVHFSH